MTELYQASRENVEKATKSSSGLMQTNNHKIVPSKDRKNLLVQIHSLRIRF